MLKPLVTAAVVVGLHHVAAADEVGHVCVRNARFMTCADGTTIDVCDLCPDGSGGGGSSGANDPNRKVPVQGFSLGLMAGPSYKLADDSNDPSQGFGIGFDGELIGGGKPVFGLVVGVGVRGARTVDRTSGEGTPRWWLPVQVGLNISPRIGPHARVRFGASGGMAFGVSEAAKGAFIYDLWAGLAFFGKGEGLGIDIVHSGMSGDVQPPAAFLRLSFLHRSKNLEW